MSTTINTLLKCSVPPNALISGFALKSTKKYSNISWTLRSLLNGTCGHKQRPFHDFLISLRKTFLKISNDSK